MSYPFSVTGGETMKVTIQPLANPTKIGSVMPPNLPLVGAPQIQTLSVAPTRTECKSICANMASDSNTYFKCGESSILRSALAEEHEMVNCIRDVRQQAYDCAKTCESLPIRPLMSGKEFMQNRK